MLEFPLAIYTAKHGLEWTYPRGEIDYVTLDKCRKVFGGLPDFDAGEPGFDGVWITENLVFVVRCQSVDKWDFRGRRATYLAVTWMPRKVAKQVNVEALLLSPSLSQPSREECLFFKGSFMSRQGSTFGNLSQLLEKDGQSFVLRRSFGETTVKTKMFESVTRSKEINATNSACIETSQMPSSGLGHGQPQIPSSPMHLILMVAIGSAIALFMSVLISICALYYFNHKTSNRIKELEEKIIKLETNIEELKVRILPESEPQKNQTPPAEGKEDVNETPPAPTPQDDSTKKIEENAQLEGEPSKESISEKDDHAMLTKDDQLKGN